ncbi:MAG TPA: LLM class flavin-dependent oxidoreductase [Acetobacteraceae bacterium]|jgi:alkanesulfonate monooxygenase SsuD/methylene tetrahydromethanopterin reductase-like flavin-dependent oxidoreductase (luciferase family)|nr:LLM class flavin-dependent oxidoreductase [Acetobacteraceae bacterium]
MKLAIWSTTAPRENSTHAEMFRRQLEEVELADRIGIDQIWFFEHHLIPTAPVPSPNLLIAAAARTTSRIRFASMVNILPFRHPLLVAEEAAMLDNLTDGRFDMGLGRGLRPPEFAAFGVDQQQSREMFLESFDIIRRVWADEMFSHRGKFWTVDKNGPLSPPLVQRPHPPFLVSAQSEESLRWAAQHDIRFAQIDSLAAQARRDAALYREVQTAHGHAPAPRLYLMREIYVSDSDARARAEAEPYLLQYWDLWNRYTQFTQSGRLPDSYDFWRRQAPMLHAMSFDEIVANDMVILGGPETVAATVLRLASQLDLMGLTLIFKLGVMPYDMVEQSMRRFGDAVIPRIREVLCLNGAAKQAQAA